MINVAPLFEIVEIIYLLLNSTCFCFALSLISLLSILSFSNVIITGDYISSEQNGKVEKKIIKILVMPISIFNYRHEF